MGSPWRVGCVRIPRFPIGAAWHAALRAADASPLPDTPAQLELGLPEPLRRHEPFEPRSHGREERSLTADPLHWDHLPLALEHDSRLRAVSAGAGRRGLRAGMALPEARARCAELVVLAWDEAGIARAITETTIALLSASPQVTPVAGAPGTWWVGASGFDALGGERTLARDLLAIASRWHPGARVAIADSCVAARAGTWMNVDAERFPHSASRIPRDSAGRIVVVRPHGDAAFLAPVPLALVPMDDEMRQALVALGLGTLGALAALDPADVERRWGAEGLRSWRLARGEDRRRPVLARPERARFVEAELPVPAATTEPVLFLVRAALDRLVAELAAEGRAAAAVSVTLTLDLPRGALPDGTRAHTVTREVRPARPLARAAPLFEQCRALLERWTPGAPICGVAVALTATAPATAEQGDLLDTSWRDAAAADAAFARLRAALGPDVVVRPVLRDEHRPEKAGEWDEGDGVGSCHPAGATPPHRHPAGATPLHRHPAGATPLHCHPAGASEASECRDRLTWRMEPASRSDRPIPTLAPPSAALLRDDNVAPTPSATLLRDDSPVLRPHTTRSPLALRLLESPEPIDVEAPDGIPAALQWRGRRIGIAHADGPERLSGEWWRGGYRRDYWRCEGEPEIPAGRGDFLIYFERGTMPRWWMHGWYD